VILDRGSALQPERTASRLFENIHKIQPIAVKERAAFPCPRLGQRTKVNQLCLLAYRPKRHDHYGCWRAELGKLWAPCTRLLSKLHDVLATVRGSILSINRVLNVSASFIAAIVCFDVVEFDPKTTMPPIMAAMAPTMAAGTKPTAPTR
jgi:hypothetical protein